MFSIVEDCSHDLSDTDFGMVTRMLHVISVMISYMHLYSPISLLI